MTSDSEAAPERHLRVPSGARARIRGVFEASQIQYPAQLSQLFEVLMSLASSGSHFYIDGVGLLVMEISEWGDVICVYEPWASWWTGRGHRPFPFSPYRRRGGCPYQASLVNARGQGGK